MASELIFLDAHLVPEDAAALGHNKDFEIVGDEEDLLDNWVEDLDGFLAFVY